MDDENVINFRTREAAPPGLPPLPSPSAPLDPTPPPVPETGVVTVAERPRRSAEAALADLGPVRAPMPPAPASSVPATFRSEGLDERPGGGMVGVPLGALSLSAILAVALAAMRGTVGLVQDWRQRRLERATEEAAWRQARVKRRAAEEDALAAAAKIPSSAEFGRRAVKDNRPAPAAGNQGPSGKTPGKPAGPQGLSGGSGTGPRPGDKKPGDKGLGPSKDRPKVPEKASGGPSDGIVAPRKGKGGSGGSGGDKGMLGRIRHRKSGGDPADPKDGGKSPKSPEHSAKKPGAGVATRDKPVGRPGGQRGPDQKGPQGDRPGSKPDPKGPTNPGRGRGRGRRSKGVRKVPGIRHGTAEGYDTHECRCLRCKRAARRRDDAAARAKKPGPPRGRQHERPGTDRPSGGWGDPPPPRSGGRRSADEDLRTSSKYAYTDTIVTLERLDRPESGQRQAPEPAAAVTTGVRGLPRAPENAAGTRPGTAGDTPGNPGAPGAPSTSGTSGTVSTTSSTNKKETTPMTAAGSGGGGGGSLASSVHMPWDMASQHQTEVTLDEVLDHLNKSTRTCFRTYDECADLADKARKLRRSFEELVEDLADSHNIRGRLTRSAANMLLEAMELVARKAEEMRARSLAAAESVELAHDAMADAYRPVQQATRDAGLVTPSARIHNED